MSKKVEVIELSDSSDALSGGGLGLLLINVINWYGFVDLLYIMLFSLYWDTWLPEEGPFDEFPAETDKEDEDSDMSL
ncbi:hypothetical protein Tco_1530220 [Tanacetum coccineum]